MKKIKLLFIGLLVVFWSFGGLTGCEKGAKEEVAPTEKEGVPEVGEGELIGLGISLVRLDDVELSLSDDEKRPIPRLVRVKLVFDGELSADNKAAVEKSLALKSGDKEVAIGNLEWTDDTTALVSPEKPLKYNSEYSVELDEKVFSVNSNKTFKTAVENDFNGDGFPDVLIGAPGLKDPYFTGSAYLFFGPISEVRLSVPVLASSADVSLVGPYLSELGRQVAFTGDLNADGYADIVVGAPAWPDAKHQGAAYILFGGEGVRGICNLYAVATLCAIGEENDPANNKFPGVILSVSKENSWFGSAVSSAGDINADGFDDLIIGAPGVNTVHVLYGKLNMTNESDKYLVLEDAVGSEQFGGSVSSGDFNGDGFSDIVIGAYKAPAIAGQGLVETGLIYVYLGTKDGISDKTEPKLTWRGETTEDEFGWSVSSAGNVDGDDRDEILVGAPKAKDGGAVYLLKLDAEGKLVMLAYIETQDRNVRYGYAVSTAGDIDNDKMDEFMASAADYPIMNPDISLMIPNAGIVYVYNYDDEKKQFYKFDQTILGSSKDDHLGFSLSALGDLNKDGFDDIQIGAPFEDNAKGKVRIFNGGEDPNETLKEPLVVISGENAKDQFGW